MEYIKNHEIIKNAEREIEIPLTSKEKPHWIPYEVNRISTSYSEQLKEKELSILILLFLYKLFQDNQIALA